MIKRLISIICILLMTGGVITLTRDISAISAENINKVVIDFSDEKNAMVPKTGYLLTPSYNIPDSRIKALGSKLVRDDISVQNLNVKNYSTNRVGIDSNKGNFTLAKIYAGIERLENLGTGFYPITFRPPWVESAVTEQDKWVQWIKDLVFINGEYDLGISYWNVWNEYWWITREDFKQMYNKMWHAVKNARPNDKVVGPSGYTGFKGGQFEPEENLNIIEDTKSFMDYCEENGLTTDVISWHFSENAMSDIKNQLEEYASTKTGLGIKEYSLEEYQLIGYNQNPGNLVVNDIRKFENENIDIAFKGVWNSLDGLSDLISTKIEMADLTDPNLPSGSIIENLNRENPAIRRPSWWVMKAYASMSGIRIGVESTDPDYVNGVASVDYAKREAYVLLGSDFNKDADDRSITIDLESLPFQGQKGEIVVYRIVDKEDDGMQNIQTITVDQSSKSFDLKFSANDIYFLLIRTDKSAPSDFFPITPDDGIAVSGKPKLSWSPSIGATGYEISVSKNPDMSNPIIKNSQVKGTSVVIGSSLELDNYYYWTVQAVNKYGKTKTTNDVVYSFYTAETENAPGRFALTYPINGQKGLNLKTAFGWSPAYKADGYQLIVDENPDFKNPVIDEFSVSTTYYIPNDLKKNTQYYWKVIAKSMEGGNHQMMGPVFTFKTGTDGNPSTFKIKQPEGEISQRTTLKWEDSVSAQFYKLSVDDNKDFSSPVLDKDFISVNGYTFDPGDLEAGKTYYAKVTSRNSVGEIDASNNGLSFTVSKKPLEPLLKLVEADDVGNTVVYFNDESNTGSYNIKFGTEQGKYTCIIKNVKKSPYKISGLPAGTYYAAVTAVKEGLESTVFNEKQFLVKGLEDKKITPDILKDYLEGLKELKNKAPNAFDYNLTIFGSENDKVLFDGDLLTGYADIDFDVYFKTRRGSYSYTPGAFKKSGIQSGGLYEFSIIGNPEEQSLKTIDESRRDGSFIRSYGISAKKDGEELLSLAGSPSVIVEYEDWIDESFSGKTIIATEFIGTGHTNKNLSVIKNRQMLIKNIEKPGILLLSSGINTKIYWISGILIASASIIIGALFVLFRRKKRILPE